MASFQNQGPQDVGGPTVYPTGPALVDMSVIAGGGGHSAVTGLTAHAGGGQAAATPLTAGVNRINTCATAADSCILPKSVGGQIISVFNGGAAACTVWPLNATDTVNGAANVSIPAGKGAMFCSSTSGSWFTVLSA